MKKNINPMPAKTLQDMYYFAYTQLNKAQLFYGHGFFDAAQEALYCSTRAAHITMDDYHLFANVVLPAHVCQTIVRWVKARVHSKKPMAYITRHAHFQGLDFYIDERALVPRSFIGELLSDENSALHAYAGEPTSILDLCTGSGCLAILAAHTWPNASIEGVDICRDALAVAKINQDTHKIPVEQLQFYAADVRQAELARKTYDVIISNPPYVNAQSMGMLTPEYQHEPALALHGGVDGMDLVRAIIALAQNHLAENGVLLIEIGHEYDYAMAAFGHLAPLWLEVSAGAEQVFLLNYEQVMAYTNCT